MNKRKFFVKINLQLISGLYNSLNKSKKGYKMKNNSYLVKSIVALSLMSSVALASDKDLEINDKTQDKVIKNSIQVDDKISELDEKSMAKIDVSEVTNILKSKYHATVIQVKLENEDGNLVYQAEVLKNNQITDVLVDARNGKILASKVDKNEEEEEDDDNKENELWYKFWS